MTSSDSVKEIAQALLGFHRDVNKIPKDSKNPFFGSDYADLPDILSAIREPLINNGLVVLQFPESENMLTTRLQHISGEWIQSIMDTNPLPDYVKDKDRSGQVVWRSNVHNITPQSAGAALTYARRYALAAILSLNIDKDDDGNQASGRTQGIRLPILTEGKFNMISARIKKGEKGIIEKAQQMFTISKTQLAELQKLVK